MLFRARLAVSFFAVLLAVLVFLAVKEMFGTWAGFIALALLAFDPNFLAHGAVVGTDTGLSCFRFASIYAFYRYVKAPSVVAAALATGLAISTKHTAILVFPMLALLAVCEILRRDNTADGAQSEAKGKRAVRLAGALLLITVISVGVLWSFYGFRYEPRANHLAMNLRYAQFVKSLSRPNDVWPLPTVGRFHLLRDAHGDEHGSRETWEIPGKLVVHRPASPPRGVDFYGQASASCSSRSSGVAGGGGG
jgi:hypothetical protein